MDHSLGAQAVVIEAALHKLDRRAQSWGDFEILSNGDLVFQSLPRKIEEGDIVRVVSTVLVGDREHGGKVLPGAFGIVQGVHPNGDVLLLFDRLHGPRWLCRDKLFSSVRLIPRLLRQEQGYHYVGTFDKAANNVAHITEDLSIIDDHIEASMAHFDLPVVESAAELTPAETVWDMRENFLTLVLSTTVPAYFVGWALSLVTLIVAESRRCATLMLLAVQGSSECDRQVQFIQELLPRLGFELTRHQDQTAAGGETYLLYRRWVRQRPGQESYTVELWQFALLEQSAMACQALSPMPIHCRAPNLKRLAVVSAPMFDARSQAPINERLSALMLKGLDRAAALARDKGFFPQDTFAWMRSEEANKIARSYFDLRPMSLKDLGISSTG